MPFLIFPKYLWKIPKLFPGQKDHLEFDFGKFWQKIKEIWTQLKRITDHYETISNYPLNYSNRIEWRFSRANAVSYILLSQTSLFKYWDDSVYLNNQRLDNKDRKHKKLFW